jgi:RES domain-containing protein
MPARSARAVQPSLLTSFRGVAYCHVPADEPIRIERLVSADGDDDRWNAPGEPTLYLATDPAIAVAELARHAELYPGMPPYRRRLLALRVSIDGLLDLRRPDQIERFGVESETAFRERDTARRVAAEVRSDESCVGLLVPSIAFLDDPRRGNIVLFMERWPEGIRAIVDTTLDAGLVELRPAAAR